MFAEKLKKNSITSKLAVALVLMLMISLLSSFVFAATDLGWGTVTLYTDSGMSTEVIDSTYTYDTQAKEPYVKLEVGSSTITTGYTVEYLNNLNANDMLTLDTTGGNYKGRAFVKVTYGSDVGYVPFVINRRVVSTDNVDIAITGSKIYDGTTTHPQITKADLIVDGVRYPLGWTSYKFDGTDEIDVIENNEVVRRANGRAVDLFAVSDYYIDFQSTNLIETDDSTKKIRQWVYVFPRPITCTWGEDSFEYDGNPHIAEATVSAGISGATVTWNYGTGEQKVNVGTDYPVSVIPTKVTDPAFSTYLTNAGYTGDKDSYTFMNEYCIPRDPTQSYSTIMADYASSMDGVYDENDHMYSMWDYLEAYYIDDKFTSVFEITPAKVTVQAENKSMEKGDAVPALTYTHGSGVNGEVPAFTGALTTTATSSSNAGTYDINQGTLALANGTNGFLASNYEIEYTKGTLTVTEPAGPVEITEPDVTVDVSDPDDFVYDGTAKTPTVTVTVNGTVLTKDTHYTLAYTNNVNVNNIGATPGTPTVTVTGITAGGYTGTVSKTFTITPATLTVTADNKTMEKGAASLPELTHTDGTAQNGETPAFTGALTTTATTSSDAGPYPITQGTLALTDGTGFYAGNYTMSFTEGTLTVTEPAGPVEITEPDVTVDVSDPDDFVYDGTAKTPTVTVTVNGTVLTKDTHYTLAYTNNVNVNNVGATPGTPTVTVTGITAGGYTGTVSKTFTITPATLTVTADNKTMEKGAASLPELTHTDGTAQNGETPAFTGALTTTATTSSDAGPYPITQGTLALTDGTGFYAGNYTMSFTEGTLTVTEPTGPKTITEDDISDPIDYEYDGTAKKPSVTVTVDGTVLTENVDYTLSYSHNVFVYAEGPNPGAPTVTVTGSGDYTGVVDKTFNITPKFINYDWSNRSFVYDGHMHIAKATIETGVSGETVAFGLDGAQVDVGEDYPASISADSESITGGNEWLGNYRTGNKSSTFEITPLPINEEKPTTEPENPGSDKDYTVIVQVTWDSGDYIYDGTVKTPGAVVTRIIKNPAGETVEAVILTPGVDYDLTYSGDNKNAGSFDAVVTGKGNYTGSASNPYPIAKVDLTVTAKDYEIKKGDPIPSPLEYEVSGEVAGETAAFTGTPTTTADASSPVDEYPIVINGNLTAVENGNFKPDNYNITYVDGTLTIGATPITEPDVTVDVSNPDNFVYDGTAKTPTVVVIVDGVTLTSGEHYTVEYSNNIQVTGQGTTDPTVTVTGLPSGGYSGTVTKTFDITKAPMTLTWGTKDTFQYDGEHHIRIATVETGVSGEKAIFTIAERQVDVHANYPADVTITGIEGGQANLNNYILPTNTHNTFSIVSLPIDQEKPTEEPTPSGDPLPSGDKPDDYKVVIEITFPAEEFTYSGDEKKPEPTVELVIKDGTGTEVKRTPLESGDYELSYRDNVHAAESGDATPPTVIVTGTGTNITGTVEKPFTINPRPLTVTWNDKDTFQYDGMPHIRLAKVETGLEDAEKATFTIGDKQVESNPSGEKYTATITVSAIEGGRLTDYIMPEPADLQNTFKIVSLPIDQEKPTEEPADPSDPLPPGDKDDDYTVVVEIVWPDEEYEYDGTEKKPEPTSVELVIYDPTGTEVSRIPVDPSEYSIEYEENTDAGESGDTNPPTVKVVGEGPNITGEVEHPFTIKPRPLTVKADDKSKTVGKDNPALTYKTTGQVAGETPAFDGELETTCEKDSPKGTYPIYADGKLTAKEEGKFKPSNYEITYIDGTLTVKKKSTPAPAAPSEPNEKVVDLAVDLRSGSPDENKGNPNHYRIVNEEIIYWVDYINGGDSTTKKVNLVLELPLEFNMLDSDGGKVDKTKRTVTWTFNGLNKNEGGTKEVHLKYTKFSKSGITEEEIYPYAKICLVDELKDDSSVHNIIYTEGVELGTVHKVYMYGDLEAPTFRPTEIINRAEGAMVLLRIFDIDYSNTQVRGDEFSDLDDTYFEAQKGIVEAAKLGLINGYEDGTYRPNRKMTRGEFMKLIAVYVEYKAKQDGIKGINLDDTKTVTKYAAQNNWTNKYVTLLNRLNLTPISEKNPDLDVDEYITRAEIAQLCNLYLMRAPVHDDGKIELPFVDVDRYTTALWGDIVEATRPTHNGYDLTTDTYEIWKQN